MALGDASGNDIGAWPNPEIRLTKRPSPYSIAGNKRESASEASNCRLLDLPAIRWGASADEWEELGQYLEWNQPYRLHRQTRCDLPFTRRFWETKDDDP